MLTRDPTTGEHHWTSHGRTWTLTGCPAGGKGVRIATDLTSGPGPGVVVLSPRAEMSDSPGHSG